MRACDSKKVEKHWSNQRLYLYNIFCYTKKKQRILFRCRINQCHPYALNNFIILYALSTCCPTKVFTAGRERKLPIAFVFRKTIESIACYLNVVQIQFLPLDLLFLFLFTLFACTIHEKNIFVYLFSDTFGKLQKTCLTFFHPHQSPKNETSDLNTYIFLSSLFQNS